MKSEENDFTMSAPEGWEVPKEIRDVEYPIEVEKKKRVWIEPVVLFLIAVAIDVGGRMVIEGTHGHAMGPGFWTLMDLTSGALALYAIGKGAWIAFRKMGIGVSALAVGIAILLFCWLLRNSLNGMIAGGFIALIGAVLCVGRRRED